RLQRILEIPTNLEAHLLVDWDVLLSGNLRPKQSCSSDDISTCIAGGESRRIRKVVDIDDRIHVGLGETVRAQVDPVVAKLGFANNVRPSVSSKRAVIVVGTTGKTKG